MNVDPRLTKTLFHIESSGNPNSPDSSQGAEGGMQILPKTAAGLGISDSRDINQAIYAGTKYFREGLDVTGSPMGAFAYYHGGPDRSQWGPKTAAYVAQAQRTFPTMQMAAAPQITATPEPDFNTKWGLTEQPAPPAAEPAPSSSHFEKKWGLEPANTNVPAPPVAAAPDYAGWDTWKPTATSPNPLNSAYQSASNALAPAPNATYGNLIPFARDNATGATRAALPMALRDLGQGAVDLAFGPALGTVTSKATMALTNAVPALMTSPAHVPGRFSLYPREAPNAIQMEAQTNPLASVVSAPPAQVAPPAIPPPLSFDALRGNPEAVPVPASAPGQSFNPLRGDQPNGPLAPAAPQPTPSPLATAARVPSAQEAAELAAIPEKLPPAPLFPPVTQSAADARADQLIQHFHSGNPVATAPDIVPGYLPKLSGLTNDPGIATLERGVQAVSPGAIGLRDQANRQAIHSYLDQLVGTPEDVSAAQAARETATAPMRDAALSNAADVDAAPIVSQIDKILASPEGKRSAVSKTLTDVRDSLFDADGNLETDPAMLYGVRKHLNDLLDPVAQKDNPQLQQAARQLLQVKGNLDDVIESGASGFKDYVDKYAELSKPIDAQRYLQSLNLTDSADTVRLQKVDTAIKSIERQQNMPGVQKATAVSPEQLDALKTLRNTLRMDQFSATAGKHLGANTFQNLATNSIAGRVTGNPLVSLSLGGLGAAASGPLGAMAAAGTNMAVHHVLGKSESMVQEAIIRRLLNHEGAGAAAIHARP